MTAINRLADRGMYFFDYGNAFLLEASRAGKENITVKGVSHLNQKLACFMLYPRLSTPL